MVLKFNGYNQDGWFQTGKGEVVTVWSAHHAEVTGVNLTRAELVSEGILASSDLTVNSITINGVTYSTDAAYDDALWAQSNFDNIVSAFAAIANPVYVKSTDGVATAVTPVGDFASVFLGGSADTFGSELIEGNGVVWRMDLWFEQKGMFHNSSGTAGFVKGDVSIGLTADNYGSSDADIHAMLQGVVITATSEDLANMVDVSTSSSNAITTAGDAGTIISGGDTNEATSQSVVISVDVAPDIQS